MRRNKSFLFTRHPVRVSERSPQPAHSKEVLADLRAQLAGEAEISDHEASTLLVSRIQLLPQDKDDSSLMVFFAPVPLPLVVRSRPRLRTGHRCNPSLFRAAIEGAE